MAKVITTDIPDLNVSWENYAGTSVEKFIKNELKGGCGYIYRSRTKEGDYYYLYGFHNYEDYDNWANDSADVTPLFRVQLPNIENDIFASNLYTTSNTNKMINLGAGIKLNIRYTSTSTNPSTQEETDTFNEGSLIITRSANGSAFIEVGRVTIQPTPIASDEYQEVDITRFLADGDNKIRIRVEDNVNGSTSNVINFNSIVNTTLRIQNATNTVNPLRNTQLMYYIEGQVAKTLNISITQSGNTDTFQIPIGTGTYTEAPYIVNLDTVYETGTIDVESWLSVDDTVLESDHISNQFYYINGDSTETVIVLNNRQTTLTNYANAHFFDFVIYNSSSDVNIKVEDQSNVYVNYTMTNCQVNTLYSFFNTLQIESEADTINAMVKVTTNSSVETYQVVIDNREKMNPTAGADFVMSIQGRNNTETHPTRMINEATGANVTASMVGFNFVNDGWINDDEGYKILRIPSNRSVLINYDPLDNLVDGTTIELDFKTYNIFDDSETVFSFSTQTQDNKPLGFIMNPTEAAFYTVNNQVKRDQDVVFQEEVRTHLAINIIPNLANSGLNYIRIFINGVMNREMVYSGTDIFKNGACTINIGATQNDIDIYGFRIYKKALSASDVRKDYMSTIPTIEGKLAFKTANDILSANNTISYDKASVRYNTLVWTGNIPSKVTGNVEYRGTLNINIIGDPAHSGTITNLRNKGQGSSSRTYWKWNQQYDWNKYSQDSVWTDGNGEVHTDGYKLTDNDPAAKKLVAKLNWASSMQSHKIGSTALYTDLWKAIVGGNSITNTAGFEDARVTVHEKPFLFFVKDNESAAPVFYGLMTFGSGKYDKPTFGYDKHIFPDYLMIEGSDNGMPLTSRQVPWFEDEVTYNEEEEYYEYAGSGNWDFGMGDRSMINYFITANNFVYLHSPRLKSYSNDNQLTDPTYQYWNTSTYKVVRYDYITGHWVNAGTSKVDGEYTELDIRTQTGVSTTGNPTTDNNAFIAWRLADFKSKIGLYYNVSDVLFSMAFLKLIAASDNRCKNIYEYIDPVTYKICLAQDDMDTLMLTDNVGRKTKPYYVEEHDTYTGGDGNIGYYFNGQDNVFFSLMDMTYDTELRQTMKAIFTEMRTVAFGESAEACLQNYFFSVQEYFPAVAYNETARLLYEEAAVAQSNGVYINGTPAISQSLGNQLEAEKQWFKRRLKYLQSWAAADPFYVRSVISPALNFRSILTTSGTNPSYTFTLTPWQWLYPKVGIGQTLGADNTRVPADSSYGTLTLTTDGNTDTFIYGADYYKSFGEFGDKPVGETFQLAGKKLIEFSADSRKVASYQFRPTAMTINCPALRNLTIYGCSSLTGSLDLRSEIKLETVDLRNTGLTTILFPSSGTLTSVMIPNVSSISLLNCSNLETFVTSGYSNLLSVTTDNSIVANAVITNAENLTSIDFRNISLNISSAELSTKVYNFLVAPNSNCTGTIQLNKTLTTNEKIALINKYGDIDNPANSLYVRYTLQAGSNSITITGDSEIGANRSRTYSVNYDGNDFNTFTWTILNAHSYTVNGQSVTIKAPNNPENDISISVSMTRISNTTLTASKTVDVVQNITLTEIVIDDVEIGSPGTLVVPVTYLPINNTATITNVVANIATSSNCSISTFNKDNITLDYHTSVGNTQRVLEVSFEVQDEDYNSFTTTFNVTLKNHITSLQLAGGSINISNPLTIWTR